MSTNPIPAPRQRDDPRQAKLFAEPALRPTPPVRPPFIATDPPEISHALVEIASGIFGLIRRDDIPEDIAALIDDWRMDYALKYIPSRLSPPPPAVVRAMSLAGDRLASEAASRTAASPTSEAGAVEFLQQASSAPRVSDWVLAIAIVLVLAAVVIICGVVAA